MTTDILQSLLPFLLELAGLLLAWLAVLLRRRFGIEIEAMHREAKHSAIMSGVARAIELGGDRRAFAREALPSSWSCRLWCRSAHASQLPCWIHEMNQQSRS